MTAQPRHLAALALAPLTCLLLAGCRITKHENGDHKDVDIQTPFGSTTIKTNDNADTSAIGLSVYPGAVPIKDDDGDKTNADINMNFGSFHMGVKTARFQTPDPADKVLAFYRNDLSKYGDVIECRGNSIVGSPSRTSQGLTCDENTQHKKISTHDQLELRAGSQQHQHIVSVDNHTGGGTRIGLVLLDLPSHLGDKSKDPE
jgi:hypothetical protein